MPPHVHHERVFFSGRVQGVGFRYAALQVAREFEVAGYVANLPDGRVQVEAEGRADEVAAFIAAIEERMQGYIRKIERSTGQRSAQFEGFIIDSGFR
jgi:acylphosphatase